MSTVEATITLDMKKYRIRIYKSTLHQMGDPKYIQLLIDAKSSRIAIRPLTKPIAGDQIHEIKGIDLRPDSSYELYSKAFFCRLQKLFDPLMFSHSYHLSGYVSESSRIAVFSLVSAQPIEVRSTYGKEEKNEIHNRS